MRQKTAKKGISTPFRVLHERWSYQPLVKLAKLPFPFRITKVSAMWGLINSRTWPRTYDDEVRKPVNACWKRNAFRTQCVWEDFARIGYFRVSRCEYEILDTAPDPRVLVPNSLQSLTYIVSHPLNEMGRRIFQTYRACTRRGTWRWPSPASDAPPSLLDRDRPWLI